MFSPGGWFLYPPLDVKWRRKNHKWDKWWLLTFACFESSKSLVSCRSCWRGWSRSSWWRVYWRRWPGPLIAMSSPSGRTSGIQWLPLLGGVVVSVHNMCYWVAQHPVRWEEIGWRWFNKDDFLYVKGNYGLRHDVLIYMIGLQHDGLWYHWFGGSLWGDCLCWDCLCCDGLWWVIDWCVIRWGIMGWFMRPRDMIAW